MVSQVAGRKQKVRFKDTDEGDVELAETEVNDEKQDPDDKKEQEGEQGSGEESDKAAEEQTTKDVVTLSTFGHTLAEDGEKKSDAKNTEEKEEAAKLDDKVVISR